MLAEDELTDEEISQVVGVTRRTLCRWKEEPQFLDAIAEHTRRIEAGMLKLAIAKRHKRMETLNDLYAKSLQVVRERAEAYAGDADAHGGETGLLVRQEKIIGGGRNAQTTAEYVVDTGLVKQIESLMERASKEMGQEVDRSVVDMSNRVVFEFEDV